MKFLLRTATALSLTLSLVQPAFADSETEALRAQIKALETRLDQLEKKQKQAPQKVAAPAAPAATKSVDQRLAIVERNQELAQEDAKTKAATNPKLEIGSKGIAVTSADSQYSVRMRAYGQFDNRTFFDSGNTGATSAFLTRALRPIMEAKMTDYFNARVMMDFGQSNAGNTRLLDAYGEFHPLPGNDIINLRAGEMKVPVGLERWQAEQEILFTERGMTTNLVPFRDIGVALYGQLIPDQLEYYAGVVNGASDLQVMSTDNDSNKDFAGRIMAHPLTWSGVHALEGLAVGVAGTYGVHQGTTSSPGLTTGYLTTGQRAFFTYTPSAGTVFANGNTWRANPQLMYYNGPLGMFGEYVLESQDVAKGTSNRVLRNQAWEGVATYVLTGEDASFDGVKPAHNFDPAKGEWGAFELVSRYSQLNIDKNTFPTFANISTSAKKAQEAVIGGTWYFNPSVKLNLDYSFDWFDGGRAGGLDREDERVLMTRAQLRF